MENTLDISSRQTECDLHHPHVWITEAFAVCVYIHMYICIYYLGFPFVFIYISFIDNFFRICISQSLTPARSVSRLKLSSVTVCLVRRVLSRYPPAGQHDSFIYLS